MKIGIIGTGTMGRALGLRWAGNGHQVPFGSRDIPGFNAMTDSPVDFRFTSTIPSLAERLAADVALARIHRGAGRGRVLQRCAPVAVGPRQRRPFRRCRRGASRTRDG